MKTVRLLTACSGIAVCGILLTGCGGRDKHQEREDSIVKVKEITVGSAVGDGEYKYSGTIEEESGATLSFSAGGTVSALNVKVGDRVRRGQLIASVNPATARNSYDMAQSTLRQAEDAYRRMKQLHDNGSLPDIKWVEVQSQLSQAESAASIAKKNLDDCHLYAPQDGVISEKFVEAGQNVAPGMPVVKVVTTAVLDVKVAVPEGEVAGIALHRRARVSVPACGDKVYHGEVVEKGVIADPVSRSYSVKIRIADSDSGLLPGMVARVGIGNAATTAGQRIVVPSRLLQLADDNSYFVWVDEKGKAARRTVVCGDFTSEGVSIESGLSVGDRVISEGQQKVCNGTKIKAE